MPPVSVVELPEHIVDGAATADKIGGLLTVTTTVLAVATHPLAEVPFKVYVMVTVGLAVTLAPVVALKAVLGVHVYVLAPLPVKVVEPPEHIVDGAAEAVNVGVAFTVNTTVPVALHPEVVPVTVYVWVVPGFAVTGVPIVALSPVDGLHEYVVPPLAVKVVEVPEHMVGKVALALTVGVAFTVIYDALVKLSDPLLFVATNLTA